MADDIDMDELTLNSQGNSNEVLFEDVDVETDSEQNFWTEEEKQSILKIIKWHADMATYYNQRLKDGPSTISPPKKPVNDMLDKTVAKSRHKAAKCKAAILEKMTGSEFNEYLKRHISNENIEYIDINKTEDLGNNLNDMAIHLKRVYEQIEQGHIQSYYMLGIKIGIAKAKFRLEKRESLKGIKITWDQWIEKQTGMSPSYCRQLKQMSQLISSFPKLQHLRGIPYTKLYNLRNKIKHVFQNTDIAKDWQ